MTERPKIRLFLDSNVLTAGIVSPWGLDKAILSLCAARLCKLVLAEVVRDEVEENLLTHADRLDSGVAEDLLEDYRRLIRLMHPEMVQYPAGAQVRENRHAIRQEADVPVWLSAVASKPDWLLTNNTQHFSSAVRKRCGVRIATPMEFFRILASRLD